MERALASKFKNQTGPGVYIFKDAKGRVLYVGKARNLSERLSYYFGSAKLLLPKTRALLTETKDLETMETVNEVDALILEASLIKKYKPTFNTALKDGQSFLYVEIEKSTAKVPFPRLCLTRNLSPKGAMAYGPFPYVRPLRNALGLLRPVFNYRDCSPAKYKKFNKLGHGCLLFDLKLCGAPCAGKINRTDYQKNLTSLKLFFKNGSRKITDQLTGKMQTRASALDFEGAAVLRQRIDDLKKLNRIRLSPAEYIENPNLTKEVHLQALEDLRLVANNKLGSNLINHPGFRLEAFDVSHSGAKGQTASLVVFEDGQVKSHLAKRFRLRLKKVNDLMALTEVLRRRFGHPEWAQPDLILVDGGIAQVKAARRLVEAFGFPKQNVLGLAKNWERLCNAESYLRLPKDHPGLLLLRRVRDEAHRFANKYRQLLKSRELWSP